MCNDSSSAPPDDGLELGLQGSEAVPSGRALERLGDGVLFVTYSLLISGLNGGKKNAKRKADGPADDNAALAAGAVAAAAHGRIK